MKSKILLFSTFLALSTLFTFSSCGDDDADGSNSDLVGTWILIRNIDTECNDPSENLDEGVVCDSNDCLTFLFNSDNTFQATELEDGISFITNGNYSINGDILTLTGTVAGSQLRASLSFLISNDQLTLVDLSQGLDCTLTTIWQRV